MSDTLVCIGWILALGFMYIHIFTDVHKSLSKHHRLIYFAVCQELFACSISWIIFACHSLKTGGVLRTFLSSVFWQPLSKLCLCVYVIHFFHIYITLDYSRNVAIAPGIGWILQIVAGDIVISTFYALILHLCVEAPVAYIVKLLFKTF